MPTTKGFQLVDSDLLLLRHVYALRLATIDHLAALSGRSYKRAQERLDKLVGEKYLKLVRKRPEKHVYAIDREGAAALIHQGHAPRELAGRRLRENELKPLGIQHAVFIADIHAKLIMLTQARSLELSRWVEGPSLWDRVTTSNNAVIPIRPDAWFTIEGSAGSLHFFLEADRGTMAHSRMREKVTGYSAYFQQRRHLAKFEGMDFFRVATVTATRGRADGLAAEFKSMMPARWAAAYPVIAFDDLTLERLAPELARETAAVT